MNSKNLYQEQLFGTKRINYSMIFEPKTPNKWLNLLPFEFLCRIFEYSYNSISAPYVYYTCISIKICWFV